MYGIEIPTGYAECVRLDKLHGNDKWQQSTKLEMDQLHEYDTFHDKGIGTTPGEGFKKIRVHLVYAVKHDGRHKARLCANGNLTEVPIDSVYSGVVSLKSLRTVIFLAELNGLKTWTLAAHILKQKHRRKCSSLLDPNSVNLRGTLLSSSRRCMVYGLVD